MPSVRGSVRELWRETGQREEGGRGKEDVQVVLPTLSGFIGKRLLARNDRLGEPNVDDVGVIVEFLCERRSQPSACPLRTEEGRRKGRRNVKTHPNHRKRQPLDIRPQRTKVGAEEVRQHIDTLVDEVDGCSARSGFGVHGVVGVDEVRDVGDVCSECGES
jgi:hypothetical protein